MHSSEEETSNSAFVAVDSLLKCFASLIDKTEELAAALIGQGFVACKPALDEKLSYGDGFWTAWCETGKERLGRRTVTFRGDNETVGYVSDVLPAIRESVGIMPDKFASTPPRLLFENLAKKYSANGRASVDSLLQVVRDRVRAESRGALDRTGFDGVECDKRTHAFLESKLAGRGYRPVKRHTIWSEQMFSRRVGPDVSVEFVVPRRGSKSSDFLPRSFSMVVRPRFDTGIFDSERLDQAINSDWLISIDVGTIVPGFLTYAKTTDWDSVMRGLEAYCAMHLLIEDQIISAARSSAEQISGRTQRL